MGSHRNKKTHFTGLSALRFIAATSIIVYHGTLDVQSDYPNFYLLFLHNLTIGVDVFFFLSGFLIIYLLQEEKDLRSKVSISTFYKKRVLRIFPLYYLIIFISLFSPSPEKHVDYFSHLSFLGNFSLCANKEWTIAPLNPLWSICIEGHFYLFIPMVVVLFNKKNLIIFLLIMIAASLGYRLYAFYHIEYHWMNIYCHTLSRCDVICIGGLAALCTHNKASIFRFSKSTCVLAGIGLLILMITLDYSFYDSLFAISIKKYLFVICFIPLFFYLIRSRPTSILEHKTFRFLGSISYGLYMFHVIVISHVHRLFPPDGPILIRVILVIVFSIVVASVSFLFFEKKFMRLSGKHIFRRAKTP